MRRLLPLLCGLLLAACGQRAARPIGDFTLPVYTPRYASGFEITGAAGSRSTLVTVHNPWYGDEVTDQYLFIARDGEPAPAGFEGQVLRDEARRVVCMSGSYIAMLDALGAADRVVGVSGAQYLINETLRRRIARGEAADVGFDSNVDFERLMALRPDLVMLFGIGGADTALTGKLRELGIPYLYMGEHCEESPLGKSEWVVVAAEIAGLRTEGSRLFAAIPERYERLRALAQQTAARPRVMLNTPYRDTWFMPARNSYMVRLLEDAADRQRAGLLPHEQIRFLAQRERLQHARRSAPAESPAGRHASRARGARLRQQPPPQRGGRQRFLGIGRTASRPRAGGSGAHLPPRTLRNGRTVLLPAAGITRKPPRCAASDRSFGFPAEDGRTALFRQIF